LRHTELARILDRTTGRHASWDLSGRNADSWNIPGKSSRVLADIKGPGVITHIWMTQRGNYRNAVLQITWDDAPAPSVLCPLGDFLGLGQANHLGNEMASVAYWYAEQPAAAIAIPPVEKRQRVPKADWKFVISDELRWAGHEVKVDAAVVQEIIG
jgi:hypothetical protein